MKTYRKLTGPRMALGMAAAMLAIAGWSANSYAASVNTQIAELYQLQAAFHRAATVHDKVNGDSASVIDQRIRGAYPGRPEQMAAILAWCVSPENSLMTGQILFVDGGFECSVRGEHSW